MNTKQAKSTQNVQKTTQAKAPAALKTSVLVTLVALIIFGYVKGKFTGAGAVRSAIQTTVIGSLAAAAAFGIARAIS